MNGLLCKLRLRKHKWERWVGKNEGLCDMHIVVCKHCKDWHLLGLASKEAADAPW